MIISNGEEDIKRSFMEEIREQYNKIEYDPVLDLADLNKELANVLIQQPFLRQILKTDSGEWEDEDFYKITEILAQFEWAFWEITRVFDGYAPEKWNKFAERQQSAIMNRYFETKPLHSEQNFSIDFEIHPFRVSNQGIEKYYNYSKQDGIEVEGWNYITNTPVIIHSIGACLDDDSYMYQIKYKTITGDIYRKWVDPEILLTSNMKEMVNYGLQMMDTDQKNMKLYFKQLLGHAGYIQKEYTARKNGWKKENTIFITGSYAHTAEGKKKILALTEEIATAYEVKGKKKDWIETLIPLLEYDLIRLKCYATVTAMILRFINVKTFVLHNYFESTGLKSVSMQLASSIIGNPLELLKDADSTKVGIEKLLEYNTDTPMYFDETSNNREFQDVIYMIGNEQGKNRGNKEGGIDKAGKWKTVVQTTGELPLTKGNSTNTGQQIRVLEIYEGIPRLDSEYIERVKECLDNNYGLFLDEIIQSVFKWKDKLKQVYKNISWFFEKAKTVFADRSKNYFIALAVGGFILEDIFKQNGIPYKESIDICKKYYQRVIIEDPTIPYHLRALDTVYSWTIRNKKFFEYSRELDPEERHDFKGAIELKGWITKDSIYFDPDQLQEYLIEKGFNFERVIEDWKNNNVLEPLKAKDQNGVERYKSWKFNTTINGQKIKAVRIPFKRLKELLEIRDEEIYDVKTIGPDEKIDNVYVSLVESCSRFLLENPKYKNVTFTAEQVTDFFIRSEDREELLLYGKENIVKAFEMCKKHK